jgi:hypothetical protein
MKLWKRRVILVLSIILFLILSPSIILYSSGYRLNFENLSFKKVGMIIIESKPRDVNVWLNNRVIAKKTPHKISNLTPKYYNLKLEKEGYQTWSKFLPVESQSVTRISNILLFKNISNKDIYAHEYNILESKISPDQKYYAYIILDENDNHILRLLDLKTRTNINIFHLNNFIKENESEDILPEIISDILWSNNSKKIIFAASDKNKKHKKHIIIDINNLNKSVLIQEDSISNIAWDLNDSNFIYFIKDNNLGKLNITNQSIYSIIAKNVNYYDLMGNFILYAKTTNNDNNDNITTIYKINKNSTEDSIEDKLISQNIINEKITSIKAQKEDRYLILTHDKVLYLSTNENILKIGTNINNFEWSNNNNFLFYNDNHIWHYKIEKDKNIYHPEYQLNEPIIALETDIKIDYVQWHPSNEYILYNQDNSINVIELDSRDFRNSHQLLDNVIIDSKVSPSISKEGDKILYLEMVNDKDCLIETILYQK